MVTLDARAGKWLAIGLVASLAVNIFIAGLYAAHHFMPPPRAERSGQPDRAIPSFLDRMGNSLPPSDRPTWHGAIAKHQTEIAALGSAVREARRHVREALSADTIDRGNLETAFAELRERQARFQQSLQATIIDAALALPAPARRQMLEASRRGPVRE